jgi:hypothetical protein
MEQPTAVEGETLTLHACRCFHVNYRAPQYQPAEFQSGFFVTSDI